MNVRRGLPGCALLLVSAVMGGCGGVGTTSDLTSLLSSLTGLSVTDSTTLSEILDQLTIGDVVSAYQQYAASAVTTAGGRAGAALTSDQISQLEDLQAQLDAGTIDQAAFESGVQEILGDTLPMLGPPGGERHFGGPFGMGHGGVDRDPLDLTDEQQTAAKAIFDQLKTDIDTLRTDAKTQILAVLTEEQKTTLEQIGLSKVGLLERPMGPPMGGPRGGPMGPGHHGTLGLGENTNGDERYLDLLDDKLELTDEQETTIQGILDTLRTSVQAAHETAQTAFKALLTADQLAIYEELHAGAGDVASDS